MSIKKSFLESKWYYRIVRVIFFEVVPVLIAGGIFWMLFPNLSGRSLQDIGALLQSDGVIIGIVCVLFGPVIYLVILNGIWKVFFYVVFGGVEDDMKPKVTAAVPPIVQASQPVVAQDSSVAVVNYLKQVEQKKSEAVTWIILIILFIWIAVYSGSTPSSSTSGGGSSKTNTCIPTGCGSNWQCSGNYYSNNVQKSISGCYTSKTSITSLPSWSGICRKCP
jgi:hypothetical protein